MKLLFICKQRSSSGYGGDFVDHGTDKRNGSYGITNSCNLIEKAFGKLYPGKIECKVVTVVDNNCIDREVYNYQPTHVFIEALWVTPDKFFELLPLHPRVQWAVRIHSKTPFLANEGIALEWIQGYMKVAVKFHNFCVAGNDAEYSADMQGVFGQKFAYLPNLYLGNWDHQRPIKQRDKGYLDIGCFGAIRPMKNQLQQAVAAVIVANEIGGVKLRFHMNGRTEQSGCQVLKNIQALMSASGHELVLHGWHAHEDFLELVKTMDAGLQVSFSETFNIVAADFVMQNVPIVVSKEINWASEIYQAEPTSVADIKKHLHHALSIPALNYLNKIKLKEYNKAALKAWIDYL